MDNLTKIEGYPSSEQAIPGMAFFAGTGPEGKTCKDCQFRGYYRRSGKGIWNEALNSFIHKQYRTAACLVFKELTGKYGPVIDGGNASCKYFQQKIKK